LRMAKSSVTDLTLYKNTKKNLIQGALHISQRALINTCVGQEAFETVEKNLMPTTIFQVIQVKYKSHHFTQDLPSPTYTAFHRDINTYDLDTTGGETVTY